MIDFNDVGEPRENYDLDDINRRLEWSARQWVPRVFPMGRPGPGGREWRMGDVYGAAPRREGSCVIRLEGDKAGHGHDWNTGEGGDPIAMIGFGLGKSGRELFAECAAMVGATLPPPRKPAAARPDNTLIAAQIAEGCAPLAGSPAAAYLRARGLEPPDCADLMFHPDLADHETKRGYIGMVAIVRDRNGERTGGVHRTFLLDDGSAKAPPGKKSIGPIKGGAVRLAPIGADGRIGVAEGIETALSAMAIFGTPTWAGLSTEGVRQFEPPDGATHVTIFRDAGEAGGLAAQALADRLSARGLPWTIAAPLHGDDFNDDLLRGAQAGDYGGARKAENGAAPETLDDLLDAATQLTRSSPMVEINRIVTAAIRLRLDPMSAGRVVNVVARATGQTKEDVRKQMRAHEREARAPSRPGWRSMLVQDEFGAPEKNEANIMIALSNDPAFAGALGYDAFRMEAQAMRALPWDRPGLNYPRPWADLDDTRLAMWLQAAGLNVTPATVARAAATYAAEGAYHPVRDYLAGLTWDGVPRLEDWTTTYLGAEDTALHRAFGALWMISAVARVSSDDETKADHMIILEGPQGARKSTALRVLGGEWFTDDLAEIGSKDAAMQIAGAWIIEIAELDVMGRAESSRIKAFTTRNVDRFRPPYGRAVIERARQCVFAGTVNHRTYLKDESGNRRFWPVAVGAIDIDALTRDRDQLWAEAAHRHREGAVWWLTDPALIAAAQAAQSERYQSDAWDGLIEHWLRWETSSDGQRYARDEPLTDVSVGEILKGAIGLPPERWTRTEQMRVTAWLKASGWERYKGGTRNAREWRYRASGRPAV